MKIHFSSPDADENYRKELESYVTEEKLHSLTSLLQHGNLDLADLDIRVDYLVHHNNFLVKINLEIARHILIAEENSHNLTKAFDLALEKIIVQLRKLESIRHDK